MHAPRTRFKKEIVAEFLRPRKKSNKVIIFCVGMPVSYSESKLMKFFARKGYWFFYPRYRGTWESGGKFLRHSPEKDILDVIDSLPRGFQDLYSGKKYKIKSPEIYILGNSFGGPAAILASRDERVKRAVLVAPIVDWVEQNKKTPRTEKERFIKDAFGEAYRYDKKGSARLAKGNFYNPARHVNEINGRKFSIIHAKDDKSVAWRPVAKFAKVTGAKLILLKRGGHLSSSIVMQPKFWKQIKTFLSKP